HVVVRQAQQLLADAVAVLQVEIAHAADLVRRLAALDAAFADARMPARQGVEVADALPHFCRGRVDHGRDEHSRHLRLLFLRAGLVAAVAARPAARALLPGRLAGDALHVGRLADQPALLRQIAALDAD